MPHKDPAARKAYRAKYQKTERYRAYVKKWNATPQGKEILRRSKRKYYGCSEPTRPMPSRCECCNGPPTGQGALHTDHDHKTGKFRGWLCSKCNQGIGLLGDDALGVRFALAYLSLNG